MNGRARHFWRSSRLAILGVAAGALLLGGCATRPVAAIRAGQTAISQRWDAKVPAKAETLTQRATLPLPAGSRVEVTPRPDTATSIGDAAGGVAAWSVTLPSPSTLSVESVQERATAPQAFEPPAPPSPAETAAGRARLWLILAAAAGVALGAFGLIRGWDFVAVGGGVVAAGAVAGLALNAVPAWIWPTLAAGVAVAGTGWAVWWFKLRHASPFTQPQESFRRE